MAITWLPNPENYPIINHIDNNRRNNHVDNLEWCTFSHNIRHCYSQGRNPYTTEKEKVRKAPKPYLWIPVEQYDLNNNLIQSFESVTHAGKYLVSIGRLGNYRSASSNISSCCKGKAKTVGGYIWKYKQQ